MPSQPSTDISEEVFEVEAPEIPSVAAEVAFGKSNRVDLTVIPNDGILEEEKGILAHIGHNSSI